MTVHLGPIFRGERYITLEWRPTVSPAPVHLISHNSYNPENVIYIIAFLQP